jgi:hypothetical protein
MLLTVKDGQGSTHAIVVQAQETPTDRSGQIDAPATSQTVMVANPSRSGWHFQNIGTSNMTLSELDADATAPGSWVIVPNGSFPPPGYPVSTNAVTVAGAAGQAFVAREW